MSFEPIGGSLAAIALFFPIYEQCNQIYNACKEMKHYKHDRDVLWKGLYAQWVRLDTMMKRDRLHLQHPPDPDNRHDPVTKAIMYQLSIIKECFDSCLSLMHGQLRRLTSFWHSFHAKSSCEKRFD